MPTAPPAPSPPLTVGRLLLEDALPPEARSHLGPLDKKGTARLFTRLAELSRDRPDVYRVAAQKLHEIGGQGAMESGGYSFSVADLAPTPEIERVRADLRREVQTILANRSLDSAKREQAINAVLEKYRPQIESATQAALNPKNPLAMQIISGAKGSPANLQSLIATDLQYNDASFRPVPFPVLRSYGEGLEPHEFFAGAFGARQGITLLKLGTAKSGWAAKRLLSAAHRLRVSDLDGPDPDPRDPPRGYPVSVTDPDNVGALLAAPAGGYARNTVLTPRVLADLQERGVERILVRSPAVGRHPDGGIYARDAGWREHGDLPPRGHQVGVNAAMAVGERLAQTMISSKHTGGVAGSTSHQEGFPVLDQLISIPSEYRGGVVYARVDGTVDAIQPASQGGHFVRIGGQSHYVAPGRTLRVALGDRVEAGDELSDGLPNPAEVVAHRGIGEGRRVFVEAFRDAARRAGFRFDRRNLEVVAGGLIDHVRLHQELGDYAPGEQIPYSTLEHLWKPRAGAQNRPISEAIGHYLERPVLHYTIGTRVTNRLARELRDWGIQQVTTHTDPPPFQPEMVRSHDVAGLDPDWMTRFLGSNLTRTVLHAVHTGRPSSPTTSSFVPSLAMGGEELARFGRSSGGGTSAPFGKPLKPAKPTPTPTPTPTSTSTPTPTPLDVPATSVTSS